MKIRQHEYREGSAFCIHCGAVAGDATCNERETDTGPRAVPHSVVDDFDAIGKRMAELRAEREPPPAVLYGAGQP